MLTSITTIVSTVVTAWVMVRQKCSCDVFGLLPFFDEMGRYDSLLDLKNLPESIITIDTNTSNSVAVNQFLEDSKVVKKQKLEEYVSRTQIPLSQVQANIINELTKKNIDFHTKQEQFMNLSEFDKYAKNAYEKLFSNALKF